MPPEKRSHGRITSGNFRPHKSARVVSNPRSPDQTISPINTIHTPRVRISQLLSFPTSLDLLRPTPTFYTNTTPQDGPRLPRHITDLIAARVGGLCPPYIHLGFAPFPALALNVQMYVVFPGLSLGACDYHDPGFVREEVVQAWVDGVWGPALGCEGVCWRLWKLGRRDPRWWDERRAPFPSVEVGGGGLGGVWERVAELGRGEWEGGFLVVYADGVPEGRWCTGVEEVERLWCDAVDMRFVPGEGEDGAEGLVVDFEYECGGENGNLNGNGYGNGVVMRDIPMR